MGDPKTACMARNHKKLVSADAESGTFCARVSLALPSANTQNPFTHLHFLSVYFFFGIESVPYNGNTVRKHHFVEANGPSPSISSLPLPWNICLLHPWVLHSEGVVLYDKQKPTSEAKNRDEGIPEGREGTVTPSHLLPHRGWGLKKVFAELERLGPRPTTAWWCSSTRRRMHMPGPFASRAAMAAGG